MITILLPALNQISSLEGSYNIHDLLFPDRKKSIAASYIWMNDVITQSASMTRDQKINKTPS